MVILLVFTCTGATVAFIARPVLHWIYAPASIPWWANLIYYVLILPVYNIFLLLYGLLLGQFSFFWDFEKRFFSRIFGIRKKTKPKTS